MFLCMCRHRKLVHNDNYYDDSRGQGNEKKIIILGKKTGSVWMVYICTCMYNYTCTYSIYYIFIIVALASLLFQQVPVMEL